MNSTTPDKRVRLPVILAVSAALQAALVLLFVSIDALRVSRLEQTAADVRELDEQAQQRLKRLEERKRRERDRTELREDDATKLKRGEEEKRAKKMIERLKDMKRVRDELQEAERLQLDEVKVRSFEDVSMFFYYQLYPLTTQLVERAENQDRESDLSAAPLVHTASTDFETRVTAAPERLILPSVLQRVRDSHGITCSRQDEYIRQLDEAQKAYVQDEERVRHDNHVAYLVNYTRDQISGLLREVEAFELEEMNDLPERYEPPGPLEPDWEQSLEGMSVPELHEAAAGLQEDIEALFTAVKAADIAMNENKPLADAWQAVSVPPPTRQFSPGTLPDPPRTIAELNAYRAGLDRAERDVHDMWQQAQNMGQTGRKIAGMKGGEGAQGKGEGTQGAAGRAAVLANAARGNLGRYVDVSPFMQNHTGDNASFGAVGGGQDITHKSIRTGFAGQSDEVRQARGPSRLSEEEVLKQALPGRKFNRNSPRTGWLYIDTWYVIGPWENGWRTGFDDPLPPETLVDLDAEYVGKNDQVIRWQFHQSDNIRIKPPREMEGSTYYGYTEVYFEEPTEMIVAVASDDAAKVWINDTVIWQDRGFSPWRIDEGFRRVHFDQGFNTILLRIENGPVTCTFSLLLCPPEAG
ncbi:MAG: hypothetical protein KJ626_14385 [Verrucomicrobia bacterium]|nr:hypothetical protein [Verrucomicrobiota bacterium]